MPLLKKYIKLADGDFKKAWRLQKAAKRKRKSSSKKRAKTKKRRVYNLAKKKVRRKTRRRTFMSGLQKPLVAGVTYAFVQPFASQILSKFNIGIQDELAQILLAVVAKNMFRNRIVKSWADAAIIVNTASLAGNLAAGMDLGGLLGGSNNVSSQPASNNMVVIG